MTPPRSPGGDKLLGRTMSPKSSGSLFEMQRSYTNNGQQNENDFNQMAK